MVKNVTTGPYSNWGTAKTKAQLSQKLDFQFFWTYKTVAPDFTGEVPQQHKYWTP